MRIGIDVRMWSATGIGTYIRHLVRELILLKSDHEYILFGLEEDQQLIENLLPEKWKFVVANIYWYGFKEQLILPVIYLKNNLDVLHVPHFNVPVFYPKTFVVTLHDLTHTQQFDGKESRNNGIKKRIKKFGYYYAYFWSVIRSKRIVVPSQYVKDELREKFKIDDKKITVTAEAADPCSIIASDNLIRILSDQSISKPYFYYVGNAHPHKNLEFLLRSFAEFRTNNPNYQLVLSGDDSYFWPRLKKFATYNHLSEGVIFTGRVSDLTRDALYKGAVAYIFPSLSEGFGLPMLEAMACGCPVIASNATCLPEVGSSAAIYFAPTDQNACVSCMEKIVHNPAFRNDVIAAGFKRVHQFSWKLLAKQSLAIYESAFS